MTQSELQKVLRAADTAAVLVSARILERVIREDYRLPNMYWNIPHYKSYVCDRQMLFRHAEQADLELESDQLLPDRVILLVRPDAEELSNLERKRLLLKYWRRLFHSRVHVSLDEQSDLGHLNDQALRERIDTIGRTEFEEIRQVLLQDRWLPPNASDREVYVEFAAVYLELRRFAGNLLPSYFPGIRDFGKIEELLARDVNAADLFQSTRLAGASDPVVAVDPRPDDSQELYWSLVRSAQSAANQGNLVSAAIQRMRASRVAPAALTLPTRQEAENDVAQLSKRLGAALDLSEEETADWARHLTLLLDKADQGVRPMEARVLVELLKVCEAHEQEIYTLDLIEYLLSGGKRPIKRPLPSQRMVRTCKHLRNAVGMLGPVRLSDTDRNYLTRLMQQALRKTEDSLRTRFRPVLETAMQDVGLRPEGPLQHAAFEKMVEELLDRISNYGFLTFTELRDTISRNQLKLPDLTERDDFLKGDALVRLDRRLGSLLDGVYRPGDFYVRWLERFTAFKFGTWWGRLLTRFVTLPFLLAWVVLLLLGMVVEKTDKWTGGPRETPTTVAKVLLGWSYHPPTKKTGQAGTAASALKPKEEPEPEGGAVAAPNQNEEDEPEEAEATSLETWALTWHVGLVIGLGLCCVVFFEYATVRRRCALLLRALWRAVRFTFWVLPVRLVPLTTLQRILQSWIFQVAWWYLIKPGVLAIFVVFLWVPTPAERWYWFLAVYFAAASLLNSRIGRSSAEAVLDAFVSLATLIRAGLIPGLLQLLIHVFKRIIEAIEYLLFVADEWLRFRGGDSQLSLVVRTVASLIWAPVAFLIRFFLVVLIEPGYNPLKAPVSYMAAKIMVPVYVELGKWLYDFLSPVKDHPILYWPLYLFLAGVIWHLCDVFGFLFWEMKENWALYRANRGKTVRPAAIGTHGETVRGLLQPGFHSGTVPRIYNNLRSAERQAVQSRDWHKARAYRTELDHVADSVQSFVDREMLLILKTSQAWRDQEVRTGGVYLSTNRIRIELEHLEHPALPVEIEIEHHQGWLMAGVPSPGWMETLKLEQRRVFTACLAYLYKRADIDLVREQVKARLGDPIASWQLTADELLVWRTVDGTPSHIPLREDRGGREGTHEIEKLVFSATPLTWEHWDRVWEQDATPAGHPGLPEADDLVGGLPATLPVISIAPPSGIMERPGQLTPVTPANSEENTDGQQATEQGPETQGEAERTSQTPGEPTVLPGVHREQVQDG